MQRSNAAYTLAVRRVTAIWPSRPDEFRRAGDAVVPLIRRVPTDVATAICDNRLPTEQSRDLRASPIRRNRLGGFQPVPRSQLRTLAPRALRHATHVVAALGVDTLADRAHLHDDRFTQRRLVGSFVGDRCSNSFMSSGRRMRGQMCPCSMQIAFRCRIIAGEVRAPADFARSRRTLRIDRREHCTTRARSHHHTTRMISRCCAHSRPARPAPVRPSGTPPAYASPSLSLRPHGCDERGRRRSDRE